MEAEIINRKIVEKNNKSKSWFSESNKIDKR